MAEFIFQGATALLDEALAQRLRAERAEFYVMVLEEKLQLARARYDRLVKQLAEMEATMTQQQRTT